MLFERSQYNNFSQQQGVSTDSTWNFPNRDLLTIHREHFFGFLHLIQDWTAGLQKQAWERKSMRSLALTGFILMITVQASAQSEVKIVKNGRIDHSIYDTLLKRYVDQEGFVAYRQLKAQDGARLQAYLDALGDVDPEQLRDRAERLAYWINAYNALTIKGILYFYPTKSIREHVSVIGYNIWKDYKMQVNGTAYSLDDIEHDILRKMGDPRIHFAIVCASVSCPKLLNEPYTGNRLDDQLTRSARDFFSDPKKFRIDRSAGSVHQSPIMDWYKDDFGKNKMERLAFIKPFLSDADDRAFLDSSGLKVKNLDYDWHLNDQSRQ